MDSLFPGRSSIPRRRSAAAALAAALFASVLVVAPVAVGAANTADETLVDHDGKAGTPKVRQFAGSSRYATALAAARQFVADVESGNNFVDTAIVVSGENLVDAAAVAGLARSLGAPVLLTPAGSLLPALATFLADEFIADVIVVGGTAAVSESVVDALAKVPSVESVVRLSGRDRYATSAAVADETGAEGEYCSTGRRGAVLVNVDSTFSDALAAGPLAYASELPVLLTRADALPTDVGGFLVDEAVEQVVIVGGTAAVSAAVAAEVAEAGVSKVTRIEGANRYATSVAVAAEIARCGSVVFNANSIALANDASPAAGLVAAPMLGRGLRDAGVTPLLLVGDALPADVAAYLSSTPTRTSTGAYTDLALTAIGGTGAVSESVMEAAVAAATTSDLLSVTGVKVSPSGTSVAVTFSDQLDNRAGEATYGANRARYRIDGSALFKDDTVALAADRRSVTLTLIDVLKPGSVITVADDKIAGFGNDGRLVAGFSYTVPKRTVDRIRPRIRILASDNASQFTVFVDETNLKTPTGANGPTGTLPTAEDADVPRILLNGEPLSGATYRARDDGDSSKGFTVCLADRAVPFGKEGDATCRDPAPLATPLAAGDTITVEAGFAVDASGNVSRTTSARVSANSDYPRIVLATVTEPVTRNSAAAGAEPNYHRAKWDWLANVDGNAGVDNVLTITAKPIGPAAGALGNKWSVEWTKAESKVDDVGEVAVEMFTRRRRIVIRYDTDANAYDVAVALGASAEFSEAFDVSSIYLTEQGVPPIAVPATFLETALAGGQSSVVLRLRYNDVVRWMRTDWLISDNEGEPNYPDDVVTIIPRGGFTSLFWAGGPRTEYAFELSWDDIDNLPRPGDSVNLRLGLAQSFKADPLAFETVTEKTLGYSEAEPQQRLRAA